MAKKGIPGYIILKTIGKGGMSKVYLAIQKSVGRMIAVKILSRKVSEDEGFAEQFLKEANCGILNHPNIITIHDAGESNGHLYIAMKFLEGGDLKQKIQQGLSEKEILSIMSQMASALAYAHKNNFIHRDIKPGNILFDEDDNAVLADFGIAKAILFNSDATTTGTFTGTPNYISPEQVSDKPVDHRADLYSLGIVYYEMLTGSKPFVADSVYAIIFKQLKEPVPKLEKKFSSHQKIINKLLEKDPAKRYQTAERLLEDLDKIKSQKQSNNTNSSFLKTTAAFVILLTLSALIYTLLPVKQEKVKIKPTIVTVPSKVELETIKKLQNDIKIESEKNKALDNERIKSGKISSHLIKASRFTEIEQYIFPSGRNAFYEYTEALKLDPENIQAKTGIQILINLYTQLANNELNTKNYVNAIKHINNGLVIDNNNAELLTLHYQAIELLKNQQHQRKLKQKINTADNLIKNKKYIEAKSILEDIKRNKKNNRQVTLKLKLINNHLKRIKKNNKKKQYIETLLSESTELLNITPIEEVNLDMACENIYSISLITPDIESTTDLKESCAFQYLLLSRQEDSIETAIELVEKGLNYNPKSSELTAALNKLLTRLTEPEKKQNTNEEKTIEYKKKTSLDRFKSH